VADYIRAVAGNGERWGLNVTVLEESRELAPAQALLKYETELNIAAPSDVTVMDRLPGLPDMPLFASYRDWFRALALLEEFVTATAVLAYSNVAARRAMLAAWPEQLFAFALR